MGFLNRDEWVAARYTMREKRLDIGDDYWIENDQGEKVFKIDGHALAVRDTLVIENAGGRELYKVQERKLSMRDKMAIERDDDKVATVKKAMLSPLGDRFKVEVEDDEDMTVKGSIRDREYEIERDGDKVAEVSKKHFKMRDTYGIEVAAKQDDALLIAICVCVEQMAHGGEDERHE
jgi:uncharacterized protein YxjI